MSDNWLKIGITQGDTNGVGWEVMLKALSNPMLCELCTPVVYGSKQVADLYAKGLTDIEPINFYICASAADARRGSVNLVECGERGVKVEPGVASEAAARAAVAALDRATEDLAAGDLDAVVTAPINKESMQAAGFPYTGHTEYFAAKAEGEATMIMCSEVLRVALATVHIPVERVAAALSKDALVEQLKALRQTL